MQLADPKKPAHVPQILSILAAVSTGCFYGLDIGYSSMGLNSFIEDPQRPFNLTDTQRGSLGSAHLLAAPCGSILSGFVSTHLGRKRLMLLTILPVSLGWIMVARARSFLVMYCGKLLSGFAVGARSVATTAYISETVRPKIRGRVSASVVASNSIGSLSNYILGCFLNWDTMAIVNALLPMVFLPETILSPESPMWLLNRAKNAEARQALQRLRGKHYNIDEEFNKMCLHVSNQRIVHTGWLNILRNWNYLRPIAMIIPLCIIRQFTAWGVIASFSVDIFKTAGSTLDPKIATIILGTIQFLMFFFSGYAMDKLGRKRVSIFSACVMGLSEITLGSFYFIKANPDPTSVEGLGWLPVASLLSCMIGYSLGVASIFGILVVELIPAHIRSQALGLLNCINTCSAFVVIQTFYFLVHAVEPYGTFWIYGVACALLAVYIAGIMPETKGLNLIDLECRLTRTELPLTETAATTLSNSNRDISEMTPIQEEEDLPATHSHRPVFT